MNKAPENRRYYEGQKPYLQTCQPAQQPTVVIDNSVLEVPVLY